MRLFFFLAIIIFLGCAEQDAITRYQINGQTMGTSYSVVTIDKAVDQLQVDSILREFNQALSTYIPSSTISQFNSKVDTFVIDSTNKLHFLFLQNLLLAKEIYKKTDGAFEPTVMPLVNLWGFGNKGKGRKVLPDSNMVDTVRSLVGFDNIKVMLVNGVINLVKSRSGISLDFSALAKGYGVDYVCDFLEEQGVQQYMVEIGGEVRVKGKPSADRLWQIGIHTPEDSLDVKGIFGVIELQNQSMATSGNYQNYYLLDGKKVSHTINPKTGYPEYNKVLSATILSNKCAQADAYATACMVLGLEESKQMIDRIKGIEGYLIYQGESGELELWRSLNAPELKH